MEDIGIGIQDTLIWFVINIPYLVVWLVMIGIVIVIVFIFVKVSAKLAAKRPKRRKKTYSGYNPYDPYAPYAPNQTIGSGRENSRKEEQTADRAKAGEENTSADK